MKNESKADFRKRMELINEERNRRRNCKRHAWEINWNASILYTHPNNSKTQHTAVECSKCGETAWRNNESNRIFRR
jgi:hypothetical protein